eukprot:718271-Rhodomonas_salina.1
MKKKKKKKKKKRGGAGCQLKQSNAWAGYRCVWRQGVWTETLRCASGSGACFALGDPRLFFAELMMYFAWGWRFDAAAAGRTDTGAGGAGKMHTEFDVLGNGSPAALHALSSAGHLLVAPNRCGPRGLS